MSILVVREEVDKIFFARLMIVMPEKFMSAFDQVKRAGSTVLFVPCVAFGSRPLDIRMFESFDVESCSSGLRVRSSC
jgi:hypothetical protein